ncbi:U3 snoRNP protein [Taxawa tesnikishii (nom. ined.)]|nr:U3 snoRNP protein [Dothideales sp. JES 119]
MAVTAAATQSDLLNTLTSAPHTFLQPPTKLHASSLSYLKQTLDPIASSIAQIQQERLQEARKKRKRGQDYADREVLRLKKVHVDGFAIEQVWEQARRVIDAARQEAERGLEDLIANVDAQGISDEEDTEEDLEHDMPDGEDEESDVGEEGVDYIVEGEDIGADDVDDESEEDEDMEMSGDDIDKADLKDEGPAEEYVADPNGLNDGFFSIDDFNRQSEFLEQADARGDNDGAASDEEDIDWDADPSATDPRTGNLDDENEGVGDDGEDDEEDGPTFGNVDLNAPEGASDDEDTEIEESEMDDIRGLSNTNNIMYADFFAPPAQKSSKKKKGRPNPHNFPTAQNPLNAAKADEQNEEDVERTMAAVHRDLFDDEESEQGDINDDLNPADPRSRRSTHERRRAAIAEEIRKLEAANVAKREWTLQGEARATDRPLNSLLEEDLDFERAGKPVPVITAEVSESIEELIKRRILAFDFQDIIRRRPDDLATGSSVRRGRLDFTLDDSKSKKSLAEMYEEEHLKRTDPNHVDAQDEKIDKEQKEIGALWKDIVGKLDSLSNWHYKPVAPSVGLDIRIDAPVVRLEDARPTAGADAAGASQLAPQEVYRAGEAVERGEEVATRGGGVVAREELSREEKNRRRRREKERHAKAETNEGKKQESKKMKERRGIVEDLRKGGVKMIGKKGQITDVEGNKIKEGQGARGAGAYKL